MHIEINIDKSNCRQVKTRNAPKLLEVLAVNEYFLNLVILQVFVDWICFISVCPVPSVLVARAWHGLFTSWTCGCSPSMDLAINDVSIYSFVHGWLGGLGRECLAGRDCSGVHEVFIHVAIPQLGVFKERPNTTYYRLTRLKGLNVYNVVKGFKVFQTFLNVAL